MQIFKYYSINLMELTLDFLTGFLVFSSALVLSMWILSSSLGHPQPLAPIEPKTYAYPVHLTIYREGKYLAVDCVEKLTVRVTVMCFNGDGSCNIVTGYTPLKVDYYQFIVAFSGSSVKFYGEPPGNIKGYITSHGVYSKPVEHPYVHVDGGLVVEVNPVELGKFTFNFKRLMVVNETILLGGR
ncbi:MAG: hypothetical protein NDF55_00150 [archaeon GB-1867-005]|nr:hypothetical protein [Candidatus Culexmicrobium cathedralense]